jgi:hypothetical protein
MGIPADASYHRHVGPGDEVAVSQVQEQPFRAERFLARVTSVAEHGHYTVVRYDRCEGDGTGVARLFDSGPPDWGVIEFRVVRKVHRPPSSRQERGGGMLASPENPLVRLRRPELCPACGGLCGWRPKLGWPCLACRTDNSDAEDVE